MRHTLALLGFSSVPLGLVSKPRLDAFVSQVFALMRRLRCTRYEAVERLLYGW